MKQSILINDKYSIDWREDMRNVKELVAKLRSELMNDYNEQFEVRIRL